VVGRVGSGQANLPVLTTLMMLKLIWIGRWRLNNYMFAL